MKIRQLFKKRNNSLKVSAEQQAILKEVLVIVQSRYKELSDLHIINPEVLADVYQMRRVIEEGLLDIYLFNYTILSVLLGEPLSKEFVASSARITNKDNLG